VHGSAPDIAGQDKANPLAAILSVAMLLETSLDCPKGAAEVRAAVSKVLADGHRTGDLLLGGEKRDVTGCVAMGELVLAALAAA
jgi:3-isopropylmalate dehydrogenase